MPTPTPGWIPENENQRNFHSFLARHGYKVVSKDIRKYGDGKVKANLDIELVVDMMKTARNLDVAIVVSGDGDFAPAIRAVQEMGVRVEVISFRGNTSSDLIEVADAFYDITQVAKVDRDSSRSGRRVAGDDEDLSMTEVPDKQTEGRGGRRGRGRGRWRTRREPRGSCRRSAESRQPRRAAGRGTAARTAPRTAGVGSPAGGLVALPGEKLSRAGGCRGRRAGRRGAASRRPSEEAVEVGARARRRGRRRVRPAGDAGGVAVAAVATATRTEGDVAGAERRRGRRRRKPRSAGLVRAGAAEPVRVGVGLADRHGRTAGATDSADSRTRTTSPSRRSPSTCWPRSGAARPRPGSVARAGGRGVRSAYASAVDRERYGRSSSAVPGAGAPAPGSAAATSRRAASAPEPAAAAQQQRRGGGMPRSAGRDSAEPWTEVPPELEEILRAQLSTKLSRQGAAPSEASGGRPVAAAEAAVDAVAAPKPAGRRGGRSKVEAQAPAGPAEGADAGRREAEAGDSQPSQAGGAGRGREQQ